MMAPSDQIENGVLCFLTSGKTHGNNMKKNMSDMNLFYTKDGTAQDLECWQSRREKTKSLRSRNLEGN
jgi:hypothetical protein